MNRFADGQDHHNREAVTLVTGVARSESVQSSQRPQPAVGWDESATAHQFGGEHGGPSRTRPTLQPAEPRFLLGVRRVRRYQ